MAERSDRGTRQKPIQGDRADARGFVQTLQRFLEACRMKGYAETTVESLKKGLKAFVQWCHERGTGRPQEVTRAVLEGYQRHLYYTPGVRGKMLKPQTQSIRLGMVRAYFKWMAKNNLILQNPASEMDLPKYAPSLPRRVLNSEEAESLMSMPSLKTALGLRDRSILEMLYSTGIRRRELARLELGDVERERSVVWVRHGKGGKQRVIPIGKRALAWLLKYLEESRPKLAGNWETKTLFIGRGGEELTEDWLSRMVSRYVKSSGLGGDGACHMLRHSMATGMLNNGADIRFIQEMLGHANLSTTQVYTRVSIEQLKRVHGATHPAELPRAGRTEEEKLETGETLF